MGMHGDGDGWVTARRPPALGSYGAAGLLLRHNPDAGTAVLLQHRAVWSHHGDTWGLPGGARDSHETPEQAALREAVEESGLDAGRSRDRRVGRRSRSLGVHDRRRRGA